MLNDAINKTTDCSTVDKDNIIIDSDTLIDNPNIQVIDYCAILKLFLVKFSIFTLYYSIIHNESNLLVKDIENINQRFISNSYLRFNNEVTILIKNGLEINNDHQCTLIEAIKYTHEPQLITNFIQEESNKILKNATLTYFFEKYMSSFKSYIGMNGELNEIIEYLKDEPIMEAIDLNKKYGLRGYNDDLDKLRVLYYDLQKQKFEYKIYETEQETVNSFMKRINELVIDPQTLYCNEIKNKNHLNFENFKENLEIMNSMSIKDWTNNILHPIKGVIATRIQNTIIKTLYCNVVLVLCWILQFLKNRIIGKIPRIN